LYVYSGAQSAKKNRPLLTPAAIILGKKMALNRPNSKTKQRKKGGKIK